MTIPQLLHMQHPPSRLGGKDPIWEEALKLYNDNNEEKLKLICHPHYKKVASYAFQYYSFDPNYYKAGPSGLSQAAKDEIRQIFKEEIQKAFTVTIPFPKDEGVYKKYGLFK